MYNVNVTIVKTDTALPSGVVFGHTNLTVTDAKGIVQVFALTGAESPVPWSIDVSGLSAGQSTYLAQDVDVNGAAIGTSVSTVYLPKALTFPASTAITVVTKP